MPTIGLRLLVVAEINTEPAGQRPTYKPGMVAGGMMRVNQTITRADKKLPVDDVIKYSDNGIKKIALEFGVDDVSDEASVYMGLETKVEGENGDPDTYHLTGKPSKYLGAGTVRVKEDEDGTQTYHADWYHKTQFSMDAKSAETRNPEDSNWQTPTLKAEAFGLDIPDIDEAWPSFRERAVFEDYDDAESWIKGKANISSGGGSGGGSGSGSGT